MSLSKKLLPDATCPINTTLLPALGDSDFPFKGKIYKPGMEEYSESRQKNYAYNSKHKDEMYPALFAYPENGEFDSIISAVSFGRKAGLYVMGRSGGHQYSGVSSDNGSVIIDMEDWNTIGAIEDSESLVGQELAQKYPQMVTVGVGACLEDLVHQLADFHCTVPMGECPSVCVGGHMMQSGGWGKLNRSCGLFTEYVYGFTIVTTEGIKRVNSQSTGRELDLYNAVRGGSPGAFGIVTDATLLLLSDSKFPNSRSYGQVIPIYDDDDDADGPLAQVTEMFIDLLNKLGDSSEATKVGLECTILAKATPSVISRLPGMPQTIQFAMVEAVISDDTDESSMAIFNRIMNTTEKTRRRCNRHCCASLTMGIVMKILTPAP